MKQALLLISICSIQLLSCNDTKTADYSDSVTDSVKVSKSITADTSGNIEKNTTQKVGHIESDLQRKILGIWGLVGEENAAFIIDKNKIEYPEMFTSYNYSLINDSIKIKYDDYVGSFFVKIKGADTLTMTGDEEQTYYRIKK